ncbi:MAG: 4'-phosphopantetheinyl transferase superfamily protein [Planctomycetes bacterium]|nr:4'-phosphopantetheinyl transferase superfamily protein [Planctomycetota bacterium]
MDTSAALRDVVASFLKVDPATITDDFDLRQKLQNSVARGGLDAVIRRRLNKTCPEVYTAQSYGQLAAAVLGTALPENRSTDAPGTAPRSEAAPAPAAPGGGWGGGLPGGIDCGVDVECPANLPVADDYWESDFYRTHFTPREIAYCVEQEDPRQHFAARWCAKEALKKCDPTWRDLEMHRVEVLPDEHGKPHLWRVTEADAVPLPVAVSLTHTSHLALAFVVQWRGQPTAPRVTPPPKPAPDSATQTTVSQENPPARKSWIKRLLGN